MIWMLCFFALAMVAAVFGYEGSASANPAAAKLVFAFCSNLFLASAIMFVTERRHVIAAKLMPRRTNRK